MQQYVEIFKALSDESRLKILKMLAHGELCACDIQENMMLTQPTISHHMKVLQEAGLIESEKRGKWIYYTLQRENIQKLMDSIYKIIIPSEECRPKFSANDCDGTRRKK